MKISKILRLQWLFCCVSVAISSTCFSIPALCGAGPAHLCHLSYWHRSLPPLLIASFSASRNLCRWQTCCMRHTRLPPQPAEMQVKYDGRSARIPQCMWLFCCQSTAPAISCPLCKADTVWSKAVQHVKIICSLVLLLLQYCMNPSEHVPDRRFCACA